MLMVMRWKRPASGNSRPTSCRRQVGVPVGVGFGIRDGEAAARIGAVADAVVIGSRIIEEIENSPPGEAPARVRNFVAGIRSAMDTATQGATA